MFKELFHINNEVDASKPQVLGIRVGVRHCGLVVTNQTGDELNELHYFSCDFHEANPLPDILARLEHLNRAYYKVIISYDFPQSILTPSLLYKHDDAGLLLKSVYGINGVSTVVSEPVGTWSLHNIYAVPKEVHEWFNRHFSSAKSWHQYSVGLKQNDAVPEKSQLLVDFRTNELTVVALNERTVVLTQTFPYSTPEDVLYYLLTICKQFGFSQENVELLISGLIDQHSALYKELYQYFIHIQFRNPTWKQETDEYPLHFFTAFNDLVRCV